MTDTIEKAEIASPDLRAEQINIIKAVFPEVVTEGKIDFDRLRLLLGDAVDDRPERYTFSWAGKKDAIRLLQAPSRAALLPDEAASIAFDTTRNLFITGDNLEVMKLLYKAYFGRIRCITIDPPYNTGSDFIYPDDFSAPLDAYLRLTGQKDAEGNLQTSVPEKVGRYHSAWLSMMYPRLFLARQLLREDGVVFVHIDDKEIANLRLLMNEVFGEENFIATVCWQKRYAVSNDTVDFSAMHDYVVVYGKVRTFNENGKVLALLGRMERTEAQNRLYKNSDDDPRGPWASDNYLCNKTAEQRPNLYYPIPNPKTGKEIWPSKTAVWRYSKERHAKNVAEGRVWWGMEQENEVPRYKRFLSEVSGVVSDTWWQHKDVGHNDEAKKEIKALFPDAAQVFDTPKPTRLEKRIIKLSTDDDSEAEDIVLDFFCGSATAAQAVLELNAEDGGNRRYIMVQLPHPTGNDEFPTIAALGQERIRRVVARMKKQREEKPDLPMRDDDDLGFRVFNLAPSSIKPWNADGPDGDGKVDPDAYIEEMRSLLDPLEKGWTPEAVVWEVAVKEGLPPCSRFEKSVVNGLSVYKITDDDRSQAIHVCLAEKVTAELAHTLALTTESVLICRDIALDDETAANLALQCRLKTI